MAPQIYIETPRLYLRRFQLADLHTFLAYRNDPEVARYQSWEQTGEHEARDFIAEQQHIAPGQHGEWFQFAIVDKTSGVLVGDCGLGMRTDEPVQATIGYSFAREHQGKGYATEGVRAVLQYAFETLRLHRVTATADCRNMRSVALLERLGMRREAHAIECCWFKGEWSDEYSYAMLGREWLALAASSKQ